MICNENHLASVCMMRLRCANGKYNETLGHLIPASQYNDTYVQFLKNKKVVDDTDTGKGLLKSGW